MMRSSRRFSKDFSSNNGDSEAEPYVDNYFKHISICFCLAIICGTSSIILVVYELVRDNIFNQQLRGQIAFVPNEGPPGFPGEPLNVHPTSTLRKIHNMKRLLTFPVHVLSRWDSEDLLYLLTLSTLYLIVLLHFFGVCFVEGFRITSKLTLTYHLGSGCIILLVGISYLIHVTEKFVPYIMGAEGYSRFAHQYDRPHLLSPSTCLGLPLCYSAQNPPLNTSPVTWTKLKREAISLEFIFRICAKYGKYRPERYSTKEEFQNSEMFELDSITIRKKEYSHKDLIKLGFCQDETVKISSAVLCILFSFFCIVASFTSCRVFEKTKGDANRRSVQSFSFDPSDQSLPLYNTERMQRSNQFLGDNFDSLFE